MTAFGRGDIVRYTSRFLRAIQWVTDVPINGMVKAVKVPPWKGSPEGNALVTVQWCDRKAGDTIQVLALNLEHQPMTKEERHAETKAL